MALEALEIGVECLHGQLPDTALRSMEERIAGHDPEPPAIERISAPDAFALLAKQERQLADPPVCSAERASQK